MKKILIVTGANRGLGKAIIDLALNDKNTRIISLSRSLNQEHLDIPNNKVIHIQMNLEDSFSSDILTEIDKYVTLDSKLYFINNAGIVLPIDRIGNFEQEDVFRSIKVNVEFPVNVINWILKRYVLNKVVVVNITSGAGYNPIASWSLYCSSKAFMQMYFKVLIEENRENRNLMVYSIDPGTIDTEMQANIRRSSFAKLDYFQSLKDEGNLKSPMEAAIEIFDHIKFGS